MELCRLVNLDGSDRHRNLLKSCELYRSIAFPRYHLKITHHPLPRRFPQSLFAQYLYTQKGDN